MKTIITPEQDRYLIDLAYSIAFSRYTMDSPEWEECWDEVYSTLVRETEEKLLAHV